MKYTILKLILASLFCLIAEIPILAETIEVTPSYYQPLNIYRTDSSSATNSYGSLSNDVRYHFRIEHPTVFLVHNGGSKLPDTSMYLLRKDIGSNNDEYLEIYASHNSQQTANSTLIEELYSQTDLTPEELGCLEDGQAFICMQLTRGEYELVCEGRGEGNIPVNGEIHTSFYARQAGYIQEYPIDLGTHTCNFSHKDVGFYNLDATHKHYVYYKVHIGYPMQIKVQIPIFKKIAISLLDAKGNVLDGKGYDNYFETSVPPGTYIIRTGTYDKEIWQETNITLTPSVLGNCLESPIPLIPTEATGELSYSGKFNTQDYTDNYHGKPTRDICLAMLSADSLLTTIDFHSFDLTKGIDFILLDSLQQEVESRFISKPDEDNNTCFLTIPPGKHYLVCEGAEQDGTIFININGKIPYREKMEHYTPSTNMNYILTIVPRKPCNTVDSLFYLSKTVHRVRYFDHLGRPAQEVSFKASPQKDDLIVRHEYDTMGRDWKQWLGIARKNQIDKETKNGIFNRTAGTYLPSEDAEILSHKLYADTAAYRSVVYENPLWNRISENYGAGEVWHSGGHSHKNRYAINTLSDSCLFFIVDGKRQEPKLSVKGYYPASQLDVVRTEDEDGHIRFVFTDKWGHSVLIRDMMEHDILDTYYVYDDYGNLCFVLPPATLEGCTVENITNIPDVSLKQYAYEYCYDYRNRCISKKLPGCEPTEMIYDANNRLVFMQDGEQLKHGEWSFSISDLIGRIVLTGIFKGEPDRHICDSMNIYAVFNANAENNLYGYELHLPDNISSGQLEVLKANYYDNYDYQNSVVGFDGMSEYEQDADYGQRYIDDFHCKQLLTGSIVRVLGNRQELKSCYYYDYNRNLIQTRTTTHNGTQIVNKAKFNFSGEPVKQKVEHGSIFLQKNLSYDHVGRLINEEHIINGKDTVLFSHVYDKLGKIKSVVRSARGAKPVTTEFEYNIRDWVTSISSPAFSQELYYTDGTGTPCYNGNISSMTWQTDTLDTRGYKFSYDCLSRMKAAIYGEGTSLTDNLNRFDEQVTAYDKMGNILGLKRYGETTKNDYGIIDNLSLTYNGNQLEAVNDEVAGVAYNNNFEFKDGAKQSVEYTYDANGNLTQDLNKKITDIQYNCLNLPSRIEFGNGNSISYLYDANGTKLRTTHIIDGITTTTDYCDNAIYENGTLDKLITEYGYVTLSDTTYHYFLQDHQGNNRAVVNQDGTVEEVNHYYPFGGVFASTSFVQPFKYNGKELDRNCGLDWYDYGARMYDPLLGRFVTTDPLAESSYFVNTYAYCLNNPFNRVDPSGMASHYNWETSQYEDETGNEVSWESVQQEYGIAKSESQSNDDPPSRDDVDGVTGAAVRVDANLAKIFNMPSLIMGEPPFLPGFNKVPLKNIGSLLKALKKIFSSKTVIKDLIVFGQNENQTYHAFRHVDELGLSKDIVSKAIIADFSGKYTQVVAGKPFNQIIEVGGKRLQYTVYKLTNGKYNIGRIHGID